MTAEQRKTIEEQFYNYKASDDEQWRSVFDNTIKKYKWDREEQVMKKLFIEKKKIYNICKELCIGERTYYYHLRQIYETAFMWAKELNLL